MLLLAKLQWDVSGVTAFDFVDQLLERLPVCRRIVHQPHSSSNNNNNNNNNNLVRGHALTYVSLCCTGETSSTSVSPIDMSLGIDGVPWSVPWRVLVRGACAPGVYGV